jgi:hypothetical protein
MKCTAENTSAILSRIVGGRWKAVRNGFGWSYECDDGRRADWRGEVGGWSGDDYVGSGLYVYGQDGSGGHRVMYRPA